MEMTPNITGINIPNDGDENTTISVIQLIIGLILVNLLLYCEYTVHIYRLFPNYLSTMKHTKTKSTWYIIIYKTQLNKK